MNKTFYIEVFNEMPIEAKQSLRSFLELDYNRKKIEKILEKGPITIECYEFQITFYKLGDIEIVLELLEISVGAAA